MTVPRGGWEGSSGYDGVSRRMGEYSGHDGASRLVVGSPRGTTVPRCMWGEGFLGARRCLEVGVREGLRARRCLEAGGWRALGHDGASRREGGRGTTVLRGELWGLRPTMMTLGRGGGPRCTTMPQGRAIRGLGERRCLGRGGGQWGAAVHDGASRRGSGGPRGMTMPWGGGVGSLGVRRCLRVQHCLEAWGGEIETRCCLEVWGGGLGARRCLETCGGGLESRWCLE
ncbi:hypothetical protein KY284_032887 [Solanum tuberosum]|nr:hypothetical protein KY284_032887 [Solanum tuberosum]